MSLLAIDVGGAGLKASNGEQFSHSQAFPLWKNRDGLAHALTAIVDAGPPCERVFATMTGELADCYATKAEGVAHICAALVAAVRGRPLRIYLTDGATVSAEEACERPLAAAASNWHVLARFAGRYAPSGAGLLIDVGSTTTDLIPLLDGAVNAAGFTDPERLMRGELVYTGIERSPVCAVASALPYRGGQCPTAQELFATTGDAYRWLGDLPEAPDDTTTADGRPATRSFSRDRLARSICADRTLFDEADATAAAQAIAVAQQAKIGIAINGLLRRVGTPLSHIIISGQGEFLARAVVARLRTTSTLTSLSAQLGPTASRVAPAYALATLARELAW